MHRIKIGCVESTVKGASVKVVYPLISKQQSTLCAAFLAFFLFFSLTSVLWAQNHPAKSVKEPPERVFKFEGKVDTFFSLAENGTGFVPKLKTMISSLPGLYVQNWAKFHLDTHQLELKHLLLLLNVKYQPKFTRWERAQLEKLVEQIEPSFFSDKVSFYRGLYFLDNFLQQMEMESSALMGSTNIGQALRQDAHSKLYEIRNIRSQLGVRERKINNNEEWLRAAPGHWLLLDNDRKIYVYRQKLGPAQ